MKDCYANDDDVNYIKSYFTAWLPGFLTYERM
jgi:hypothetical protein